MKKIYFVFLFLCVVFAENNAVDFVRTGLSARALSMGNACTVVGSGVESAYFNPALLVSQIDNMVLSSAGANNFEEVNRLNVGYGVRLDKYGINPEKSALAVLFSNAVVNNIPRTYWENDRPVQDGSFGSNQNNLAVSFAQNYDQDIAYGFTLKNYTQAIDHYRASGIGLDAGLVYFLPEKYFDLNIQSAVAIHNIGRTKIDWSTGHSDTIPTRLNFGLGLSRDIFDRQFLISSEFGFEEGERFTFSNGVEYWLLQDYFALRAGLDNGRLAFGAGLKYAELSIDYAQSDYEELGLVKRISVSICF